MKEGFLRSPLLEGVGIEHGFGTRTSGNRVPGLLHARQVHGARVLRVPPVPADVEADALLTASPDVAVGVFTDSDRPRHYRLDLHELTRIHLRRAGLLDDRIDRVEGCTSCDPERFFSYRRDGHTGRLLHFIRCPGEP